MGVTKSDNFSSQQNELAQLTKAIAHPARIAILQHLLQTNSCITGNLVDMLPLSQATVSQHLKELKQVGLIKGSIEGTSVCYCIDGDKWKETQALLNGLFDSYTLENECC